MKQNNQQNLTHQNNFGNDIGREIPKWLQQIGTKFNIGVIIFTPDDRIIYSNSQFLNHCSLPESVTSNSLSIKDWLSFMAERGDLPESHSRNAVAELLDILRNDRLGEVSYDNIEPPNGKILRFRNLVSSEQAVTLFTEDVTIQKQNADTLKLALEVSKSGFFHHNIDQGITILQSSYLQNIFTSDEIKQVEKHGFWSLMPDEDRNDAKTLWQKEVIPGKGAVSTYRLRTQKNGNIWMKFSIRPIRNKSGKLNRIVGFFEDVTLEHNKQIQINQAQERDAEALKSQTQFLARISHEIRTPMNAVIGIADALIHHNHDPELVPKLELIQSSAGNILNILDDTLNHSKLGTDEFSINPKPNDPRKTIENVCALWEIKAQSNNTMISCHIEDSVPDEIIFDSFRFEQCLNNLLSNAIKFSPDGKINVVATRIEKNGTSSLLLAVKDTGIGMTAEQKERIFEPFQQADESISRRFGGTGLGLNITKNLIENMGGNISVKSEIGKGTIFILTIPIEYKTKEVLAPSARLFDQIMPEDFSGKDAETPYQRLKILVADDNATNHMVVKSLLTGVVAEIYTANHGQDVMDILQIQNIDIILMDIHMPVMDGIEATLQIRSSQKHYSDVLIIAVTADPEYQQQRLCLNIGMDFAVAKPIKLVDLLEAFDHVLALKNGEKLLLTG